MPGTIITIIAVLVGFIAAVSSYGWWNAYLFVPIALIAAILTGVLVYYLVDLVLKKLFLEIR